MITLKTNLGDIVIELDEEKAPISSENFKQYVRDGFYDGVIFHRIIPNFMIQGGGFMPDMMQKATRETIENEAKNGLSNEKYTLAMARTSEPHSASAQFFINTKDNSFLDYPGQDGWGYAVFGKVVEGTDVVDQIEKVATGNTAGHSDVPVEPVVIEKAEINE
ncbi:peptidylprolyl isomerase [Thiolapillus sp.]